MSGGGGGGGGGEEGGVVGWGWGVLGGVRKTTARAREEAASLATAEARSRGRVVTRRTRGWVGRECLGRVYTPEVGGEQHAEDRLAT